MGMVGLIEVRLINHTAEYVESFHRMVEQEQAIVDAYKTTGDADYLLKVEPVLFHASQHYRGFHMGNALVARD